MSFEEAAGQLLRQLTLRNYSQETISGYRKDLKIFREFMQRRVKGQLTLHHINETVVEDYIEYLRDVRKLQPRSQNRYITTIRSLFKYAYRKKWIETNVMEYIDNVQYERKEPMYLTLSELQALIQQISHPLIKTAIITLAHTGLRISELLNLKIDAVDLQSCIMIVNGKGNKERKIPISENLRMLLIEHLKMNHSKASDYFFATTKNGKLSSQYVNKVLRDSAKKANIRKKVSAHTLRHTFATLLIHRQVDIATLQKLLGHTNIRTTSIYLHTEYEELKKAVEKIDL